MEAAFPSVDLTGPVATIPQAAYDWRPVTYPVDLTTLGIYSVPSPSFTAENGSIFNNIGTDPSGVTFAAGAAGPATVDTSIIDSTGTDIKVVDDATAADIASIVYTYIQSSAYSDDATTDAAGATTITNKQQARTRTRTL